MTDKTDLIREIHEYVTAHGGENTATHLLVQAASAIQTQGAELEAVGAGGVQALSAAPAGFVPVAAFDRLHAHAESLAARLLAASPTPPAEQPTPVWIVNDLGELGVHVNGRFFFLYKGDNIEYGKNGGVSALHDDGTPMRYRVVGKREFGEVCHPLEWPVSGRSKSRYSVDLVYTPGLSFGKPEDGAWRTLPAAPPAEQQAEPGAVDRTGCTAGTDEECTRRGCATSCPAQQAAPKAAPGDALDEALRERDDAEDFIDALLDEVLGRERPEWSSLYGRADALNDVQERMTALHKPAVDKAWGQFQSTKAAPQQEAQGPSNNCGRCSGSGEDPEGYYDQSRGDAGATLDGPCRDCDGTGTAPQPAPAPLSDDTKRLAWMADGWTPGHEKLYAQHVLETGGVGDLDDLRTFIDKQIAAQKDTP